MWRVKQQTPTELLTLQIFTKYFLNYCWQISDEALISAQSIGCCQSSISQLSSGRRCGWLRGLHSCTHCRKATLGKPPTQPEPLPRWGPCVGREAEVCAWRGFSCTVYTWKQVRITSLLILGTAANAIAFLPLLSRTQRVMLWREMAAAQLRRAISSK